MTVPLRLVTRYSASHKGVARWWVELVCGHSFFLNGIVYRPQYTRLSCLECGVS